jgi:hypothetical protein
MTLQMELLVRGAGAVPGEVKASGNAEARPTCEPRAEQPVSRIAATRGRRTRRARGLGNGFFVASSQRSQAQNHEERLNVCYSL